MSDSVKTNNKNKKMGGFILLTNKVTSQITIMTIYITYQGRKLDLYCIPKTKKPTTECATKFDNLPLKTYGNMPKSCHKISSIF